MDKLITIRQVAALSGLSMRQVYKLLSSGRFGPTVIRINRSARIRESEHWSRLVTIRSAPRLPIPGSRHNSSIVRSMAFGNILMSTPLITPVRDAGTRITERGD